VAIHVIVTLFLTCAPNAHNILSMFYEVDCPWTVSSDTFRLTPMHVVLGTK